MKPLKSMLILFQVPFCTWLSFSQDSIAIFKVVKSKTNYTISPASNVLRIGTNNRICIFSEGEGKIAKVELTGGAIIKQDSCYIARVSSGIGQEAILSVYELLSNGDSKLAITKKYTIGDRHSEVTNMKQGEEFNKTPKIITFKFEASKANIYSLSSVLLHFIILFPGFHCHFQSCKIKNQLYHFPF